MKLKIQALSLVVLLLFTSLIGSLEVKGETIDNFVMPISLTPKQVIEHPAKTVLYAIDASTKKVYAINYVTKEVKVIQLELVPEKLYFENNELYIALLKSGHQSSSKVPEEGVIAIVDPDSFTLKEQFTINIDPFDILVNKDGFIYVSSGSNQRSYIRVYSRESKMEVSALSNVSMFTNMVFHSDFNKIYTVDGAPADIGAHIISNGNIVEEGYVFKHHNEYDLNRFIKIAPDGKYIFNGFGVVFTTATTEAEDMEYYRTLDSRFSDIDFDLQNNKLYSGYENKIKVYDYNTFMPLKLMNTKNAINYLFLKDNNIAAVTKNAEDKYFIEVFNKEGNGTGSLGESNNTDLSIGVSYQTHVQNVGWQDWVKDGALSGTEGKSFRVEGIKIKLTNASADMKIKYQTHVQNIGWQNYNYDGQFAGTEGKSYRVEALRIQLENVPGYNVQYRVHVENIGWQDWVQNGQLAGTEGKYLRIEAIQIRIVKVDNPPALNTKDISVAYKGHVQNVGWQDWAYNGELSGTSGRSLRVEALKLKLLNGPSGAKLRYQAHVENVGWQDFSDELGIAGTSGKSYRVEAIRILLENAPGYSVEYQTHVQNIGWQDWVQDGMIAGTEGQSLRIEAIRIRIVKSGNTTWNLLNWGQIVQQADILYYSEPLEDGALYKSKYDGSQKTKLTSDNGNYINIVDNWVYYSNYSDEGRIYKIKIDGTGRTKLNSVDSLFTRVVGDKIYYIDSSNDTVYKMNLDGSNPVSTTINSGDYLFSSSEDYYFISQDSYTSLNKYILSKDRVENVTNNLLEYNVTKDAIYFVDMDYYFSMVGKTTTTIGNMEDNYVRVSAISVVGDWVYFNVMSDNERIYRIRKDGVGLDLISK